MEPKDWLLIISPIVVALSTLGGILITNWFNEKRDEKDYARLLKTEKLKFRREKIELYLRELNSYRRTIYDYHIKIHAVISNIRSNGDNDKSHHLKLEAQEKLKSSYEMIEKAEELCLMLGKDILALHLEYITKADIYFKLIHDEIVMKSHESCSINPDHLDQLYEEMKGAHINLITKLSKEISGYQTAGEDN